MTEIVTENVGALVGGTAGFFIGGPTGAAIGAGLGSSAIDQPRAQAELSEQQAAMLGQATQAELDATQQQIDFLTEQIGLGEEDLRTAFAEASALLQPLTGDFAATNYARALAMGEVDPSTLPGFQFQQEQGMSALQNMLSTQAGGGISGAGMEEAIRFGQGLAQTTTSNVLANLLPFVNIETGAQTGLADLSAGLGTNLANLRTGAGSQAITTALGDIGSIQASNILGQASLLQQDPLTAGIQGLAQSAPSLLMMSQLFNPTTTTGLTSPTTAASSTIPTTATTGNALSLGYGTSSPGFTTRF